MKLIGFTFCRNEEKMIPYVIPYWKRMGYDKLIVYDNESTDNTVEILKQYPFIEIRSFHTDTFSEDTFSDLYLKTYLECWDIIKETGEIVWLSRTDFDEVLFLDGVGCCNGKSVLNGEYISKYNVFDGKMVELICGENTEINENKMAHTWKNIRGKYWQVYGNKPLLFKVNDFPYIATIWGNHELFVEKENKEVEIKRLQNTGYVYAFHLKWLDKELLKKRTEDMVKRGATVKMNSEQIEQYYEESLIPLSFPLQNYFLIEGSKAERIGGVQVL